MCLGGFREQSCVKLAVYLQPAYGLHCVYTVCLSFDFIRPSSSVSCLFTHTPLPMSSSHLHAIRRFVQCTAVCGAEDRGSMVFGPKEHLIQGQRVTFNSKMERLFPVMQPPKHTHAHTHTLSLSLLLVQCHHQDIYFF